MAIQIEEESVARQRVVEVAERLFLERGYNAISLRDLADALGIKQASLYYHFPQGKEELYVAVVERAFARHAEGMTAALRAQSSLPEQLHAVITWFATQPRMCLMGMVHADLPALHDEQMANVTRAAYLGVFQPLVTAFAQARARGEIADELNPNLLAGAFLALLDGLAIGETMVKVVPRDVLATHLINLFLRGVLPRTATSATQHEMSIHTSHVDGIIPAPASMSEDS